MFGERSFNRRRGPRVGLSVPVHVSKQAGESGGAVSRYMAQSTNLSAGGVYLILSEGGTFVPGELVHVSITVPWEARRAFPFSRIVGSSRVVRVEDASATQERGKGVALAFCERHVRLFGAVVVPM